MACDGSGENHWLGRSRPFSASAAVLQAGVQRAVGQTRHPPSHTGSPTGREGRHGGGHHSASTDAKGVCRVPRRPDLVLGGPSEKTSDGTFILKPEE